MKELVRENTVIAEENASASEELSGQVSSLGGTAVERVADLVNIAGEIRESGEDQIYSYEDGIKNKYLTVGACFRPFI